MFPMTSNSNFVLKIRIMCSLSCVSKLDPVVRELIFTYSFVLKINKEVFSVGLGFLRFFLFMDGLTDIIEGLTISGTS